MSSAIEGTSLARSYVNWVTPDFKNDPWYKTLGKVVLIALTFLIYFPALYFGTTTASSKAPISYSSQSIATEEGFQAAQADIEKRIRELNAQQHDLSGIIKDHYQFFVDKRVEEIEAEARKELGIEEGVTRELQAKIKEKRAELPQRTEAAIRKQVQWDVHRLREGKGLIVHRDDSSEYVRTEKRLDDLLKEVFPNDEERLKIVALHIQGIVDKGPNRLADIWHPLSMPYGVSGYPPGYITLDLKLTSEERKVIGVTAFYISSLDERENPDVPLARVQYELSIDLNDPSQNKQSYRLVPIVLSKPVIPDATDSEAESSQFEPSVADSETA